MFDNSFIDVAILAVLSIMLSMKILKENEKQARIAKVVKQSRKEKFDNLLSCKRERDVYNIKLPHEVESFTLKDIYENLKSSMIEKKQKEFHFKHKTIFKNGFIMAAYGLPYPPAKCQELQKEFNNILSEEDIKELQKEFKNIVSEKYIIVLENKYILKCKENERRIKENHDFHNKEYNRILAKYNLMFEEDWNKNKKTYIEYYKESKLKN